MCNVCKRKRCKSPPLKPSGVSTALIESVILTAPTSVTISENVPFTTASPAPLFSVGGLYLNPSTGTIVIGRTGYYNVSAGATIGLAMPPTAILGQINVLVNNTIVPGSLQTINLATGTYQYDYSAALLLQANSTLNLSVTLNVPSGSPLITQANLSALSN